MSLLHIAGGATEDKLDASDVFSTYLYTGNGSTQTINNGIDLAGKGGMVWIKSRSIEQVSRLFDTARGNDSSLSSSETGGISSGFAANGFGYTSSGFNLGSFASYNQSTTTYASWTFRKAPKFFDVVTWAGNGVAGRQIAHNLGVAPGMIIVKSLNNADDWGVYHRSEGATKALYLNYTNASAVSAIWNSTAPTSTEFTVSSNSVNNANGWTYVAYLFAHDPSADGIIQCGSFVGNTTVTIGWEPQYIMIKRTDSTGDWITIDSMRGCSVGGIDAILNPNLSNAENVSNDYIDFTATGFISKNLTGTFIYMVIRRPNKVPTSGSEVFAIDKGGDADYPSFKSNFPVDMGFYTDITGGTNNISSRLTSGSYMETNSTVAEASNTAYQFDHMNGFIEVAASLPNRTAWMFKRAKGFFDVVCYTGNGVAGRTINHNLGVVPELMIVKCRAGNTQHWFVYHKDLGATKQVYLSLNNSAETNTTIWNSTTPTATTWSIGGGSGTNYTNYTFVQYLFSTLNGVSKVGSYTGNGTSQTIACGFSTGSRFILIKRTDSTGDWYIWDTARGIVAANDPHLSLNTTAAEVTTDDSVDPEASGFIVNQNTATNINVLNGTYIFLAIA